MNNNMEVFYDRYNSSADSVNWNARRLVGRYSCVVKMTNYRLQQLEGRVAEHNNFARRMPVVEEQVKTVNHRIEDIERRLENDR